MFEQEMMVLSENNRDYAHTFALLTLDSFHADAPCSRE
jgi:hypothetical protein